MFTSKELEKALSIPEMKDHQVAHFGTQLCSFYITDITKSNRLLGSKDMTLE